MGQVHVHCYQVLTSSALTDVPVAQEEARHNEASTMVVNTNLNRPPLTDRKEWPAGDGR